MNEVPGWRIVALAVMVPAIGLQLGLASVFSATGLVQRLAGAGVVLACLLALGAVAAYVLRPVERSRPGR